MFEEFLLAFITLAKTSSTFHQWHAWKKYLSTSQGKPQHDGLWGFVAISLDLDRQWMAFVNRKTSEKSATCFNSTRVSLMMLSACCILRICSYEQIFHILWHRLDWNCKNRKPWTMSLQLQATKKSHSSIYFLTSNVSSLLISKQKWCFRLP